MFNIFAPEKFSTMLTEIHPRLPMRDKAATRHFYLRQLGFEELGSADFPDYLMVRKDQVEIHFFRFAELDPLQNYGSVYLRTDNVQEWYDLAQSQGLDIPELGRLQSKPWGIREFALRDPDMNLLTFGELI